MWVHVTLGVQANCWVLKDGAVPIFPDSRKVAGGRKCDLSQGWKGQRGVGSPLLLPWETCPRHRMTSWPCAPWLLLLMACVVWPLFLPFFKIQQTLIILNSSQNKIEGESQLFILKYSVSETYRANIWGLWELNLSLKLTYTRVKGLLFFICFSKITLMAVLSATLACGGRELPFLMKAWAWASCQNSRGRSMAQRGISRAQNLTDEQANVSGNPLNLNDHMY